MSTISAGTGLISGLPIQDLVDAMISLQQQPITRLKTRIGSLGQHKAALLRISAQLLAVQNAAGRLDDPTFFRTTRAISSNESILLASATAGAATGQFSLTVKNLAASHQLLSAGFASANAASVGAGTFTVETARGTVNASTRLSQLRGGAGVQLGKIRITDRSGAAATIDLTSSQKVDEVVSAINSQTQASVRARVDGDRLILTDQTGLSSGVVSVAEVGGGRTASDLGILASSAGGVITGTGLVGVSAETRLSELNDGNGVRILRGQSDFSVTLADGSSFEVDLSDRLKLDTRLTALRGGVPAGSIHIKNRAGVEADVDLSSAQTIGDVKIAIEAAGLNLTVAINGAGLTITDASTGSNATTITEVGAGQVAAALGLAGSSSTGTLTGKKIYTVDTIGDIIRVIENATGNEGKLDAAISANGLGLTLTDNTTGSGSFAVTAVNNSMALDDLGLLSPASGASIQSRRLLAGLDTVLLRSLRGGAGTTAGTIQITDRAGVSAAIDLTQASSLADVVTAINSAGTGVQASASGLGIELTDSTGAAGNLVVTDLTGTLAADLGIAVNQTVGKIRSGNLQKQYLSTATRIDDLGVLRGRFKITNSSGATAIVDLTQGNEETLQDVIEEINSRGISVIAAINANGDGLILADTAGGGNKLKVEEDGSSTAKSLGILGEAATGQTTIDGAFEKKVTIIGSDTLETAAAKIRASGAPVSALIVRDGSSGRPWRLSLTSTISGSAGELAIDGGTTDLTFDTLVRGRDATVLFGPPGSAAPLVLTSSTNTLSDAVPGIRIDLVGAGENPVTIDVRRDADAVVRDVSNFVSAFNSMMATIDELTRFDPETQRRSILSGDSTTRRIRDRLVELTNTTVAGAPSAFNRLSSVGISVTAGSTLSLDEATLRSALDSNPSDVEFFFATAEKGFGVVVDRLIKGLTDAPDGLIPAEDENLQQSEDLLTRRIDQLQDLVDRRRERLLAQFNATESIIARMKAQQSALSGLSSGSLSLLGL